MDAATEVPEQSPTARRLLADGAVALAAAGISTARLDAEVLLATACGIARAQLYMCANQPVTPAAEHTFRALLARRRRREPLQYITGRQEFWSLDFKVTPDVLIPRPETELLVELAIASADSRRESLDTAPEKMGPTRDEREISLQNNIQPFAPSSRPPIVPSSGRSFRPRIEGLAAYRGAQRTLTICDLGTGSGCLAVVLARELPNADVWAVDQSAAALAIARENARRHDVVTRGLKPPANTAKPAGSPLPPPLESISIHFVAGDLFGPIAEACFDVIVCNPPYIASSALDQLQPELAWEPRGALDGGADGLDVIRRVIAAAPEHLAHGGWLIMEIGAEQGPAVLDLARAAGLDGVSVRDDYAGRPRVLLARR